MSNNSTAVAGVAETRTKLRSFNHFDLKQLVKNAPGNIIDGLIPEQSVNIVIGDSGLGKTALMLEMALCVASGKPFLGLPVRQGAVLYVDYENGFSGLDSVLDALLEHLQLARAPEQFRILPQPASCAEVDQEIRGFCPTLVIVDALRGFDPSGESDNTSAANMITKRQKVAADTQCAFLFIHHIRKKNSEHPPDNLSNAQSIMEWLQQAAGARAIVNQTAVRIGIDSCYDEESDLIIRGHHKLKGEFGPWMIARDYDADGQPIGYRRLVGLDLLSGSDREKFSQLPSEFRYSQAETVLGKKGGKPTVNWLNKLQGVGVLKKTGQGKKSRYQKTHIGWK